MNIVVCAFLQERW